MSNVCGCPHVCLRGYTLFCEFVYKKIYISILGYCQGKEIIPHGLSLFPKKKKQKNNGYGLSGCSFPVSPKNYPNTCIGKPGNAPKR